LARGGAGRERRDDGSSFSPGVFWCRGRSRGFQFPPEVSLLAVRWYLQFGLSYRDAEELLIERGIEVDHVTVYRWVQRFTHSWLMPPVRAGTPLASAHSSTRPM
jgi:hypothetical protein